MKNKYEFLEHTADIKFRAFGKSLDEIFENAALAISEIISRSKKIKERKSWKIELEASDREQLLYNFIEELIYLLDAKNFIISKAKVKVKDNSLKAEILGDDSENYSDLDHIKAPTYHDMYIKSKGNKWEAQVVVDV